MFFGVENIFDIFVMYFGCTKITTFSCIFDVHSNFHLYLVLISCTSTAKWYFFDVILFFLAVNVEKFSLGTRLIVEQNRLIYRSALTRKSSCFEMSNYEPTQAHEKSTRLPSCQQAKKRGQKK